MNRLSLGVLGSVLLVGASSVPVQATSAPAAYARPFVIEVGSTLPAVGGRPVALAAGPGGIAVAHDKGVSLWKSDRWTSVATGPAYAVAWHGSDLLALTSGGLVAGGKPAPLPPGVDPAHALLAASDSQILLAQGDVLYRKGPGASWQREHLPGPAVALSASTGAVAFATASAVYERQGGAWRQVRTDAGITHLVRDSEGRLWTAGAQGIAVSDGGHWKAYGPASGLPLLGFTAMAAGADGDVWLGTARGAIRFDGTTWEYREGRRWLPGDAVAGIAVDGHGDAYFGTDAGVGLIEARRTTLAAKADVYEKAIDERHRRTPYGFVTGANLKAPGDLSGSTVGSDDNDGLWTGMYGAAEAFRYAATKDDDARTRARKAFEALKFLGDVTQGGSNPAPPGFIARSVLETTGTDPNISDSPEHDKQKQKGDAYWKIMPRRWPTSADGKWYWKSDASNDELVGHYFLNGVYYDEVARPGAERDEVAAVIRRTTDHLISHGFNLVDYDGKPTRWGFFSPDELNGNPWRREERGLNSLSMITYLTIAEHVTGDAKYATAKQTLIDKYGYALNSLQPKVTAGVGGGNQSDDEMAFMNLYSLMKYEKDAKLKQVWARVLFDYWQLERPELNPFFNFVAASGLQGATWTDAYGDVELDPTGPWLDQSMDTLKRFPLNLVDWRQTNSGRLDIVPLSPAVTVDQDPATVGLRRDGTVLPVDERSFGHWNTNPYKLDQGGSGTREYDGAAYLLPYWMGVRLGFIK